MNDQELESLLRAADENAGSVPAASEKLAADVRVAYARLRRRTARRGLAAALIGGYVTGALTIWAAMTPAAPRRPDTGLVSETPAHRSPGPVVPAPQDGDKIQTQILTDEDSRVSRYEILRQLGDESRMRGDLQAAVAYYGQALDAATPIERQISSEQDNWLLISLKKDRTVSTELPSQGDSI